MEIRDATLGPDHPDNGIAHHSLALSLKALGDHELASEHARRSLEIFEKAYGNDDPELTAPLGTMAAIRVEQRRFDDATEYYERALELALAALGEDHPNVIRLRSNLGVTLARGGDTERGLQLVEQSLVQREQKFGADHIDVARSLIALATVQFENRHVAASALAPAERAVKIFSTSDTDPAEVAAARFLLARILHASLQGDPTRSRALATEALRQFEAAGHPRVADVQRVRAFLKL
jgi:tetratricopeptide (TPR) repeat protein